MDASVDCSTNDGREASGYFRYGLSSVTDIVTAYLRGGHDVALVFKASLLVPILHWLIWFCVRHT